jgi:hypothetical protein
VAAKRKDYALGSLDNLIKNEDMRLKEDAEKKAKEAKEKAAKEAKDARAKVAEAVAEGEPESEPEGEGKPEPEPEPEDEGLSKIEKDRKKADEAADERIAPPAEKLFELLYDEIEVTTGVEAIFMCPVYFICDSPYQNKRGVKMTLPRVATARADHGHRCRPGRRAIRARHGAAAAAGERRDGRGHREDEAGAGFQRRGAAIWGGEHRAQGPAPLHRRGQTAQAGHVRPQPGPQALWQEVRVAMGGTSHFHAVRSTFYPSSLMKKSGRQKKNGLTARG